uniref:Ubiquitin-like domain-containing protein n=1 Tax=Ananas comosus var. bracteatus TaxID=296719 RepID=A0A6V7QE15_ANACO|nr:unnamed protein product [Ananas comosus var. bracteatus]
MADLVELPDVAEPSDSDAVLSDSEAETEFAGEMEINVQPDAVRNYALLVDGNNIVEEVLVRILGRDRAERAPEPRLFFNHVELQKQKTLADCGIKHGSVLHLKCTPRVYTYEPRGYTYKSDRTKRAKKGYAESSSPLRPNGNGEMEIFVQSKYYGNYALEVDSSNTIMDVLITVLPIRRLESDPEPKLYFNGHLLESAKSLADYGIEDGSILHLKCTDWIYKTGTFEMPTKILERRKIGMPNRALAIWKKEHDKVLLGEEEGTCFPASASPQPLPPQLRSLPPLPLLPLLRLPLPPLPPGTQLLARVHSNPSFTSASAIDEDNGAVALDARDVAANILKALALDLLDHHLPTLRSRDAALYPVQARRRPLQVTKGLKQDTNGSILVNFSKLIHTGQFLKDDPFIFSSQAKQVFYVQDPKNEDRNHVIMTKPRDLYDIRVEMQEEDDETYTQCLLPDVMGVDELNDCTSWNDAMVKVNANIASGSSTSIAELENDAFIGIKGKDRYGRVRGYGIGVVPTQVLGPQAYIGGVRYDDNTEEVQRLKSKIQVMEDTYESRLVGMQEEYESKLAKIHQNYESRMSGMQSQLSELTSIMLNFVRPSDILGAESRGRPST